MTRPPHPGSGPVHIAGWTIITLRQAGLDALDAVAAQLADDPVADVVLDLRDVGPPDQAATARLLALAAAHSRAGGTVVAVAGDAGIRGVLTAGGLRASESLDDALAVTAPPLRRGDAAPGVPSTVSAADATVAAATDLAGGPRG